MLTAFINDLGWEFVLAHGVLLSKVAPIIPEPLDMVLRSDVTNKWDHLFFPIRILITSTLFNLLGFKISTAALIQAALHRAVAKLMIVFCTTEFLHLNQQEQGYLYRFKKSLLGASGGR